jgi:hypothetical protein
MQPQTAVIPPALRRQRRTDAFDVFNGFLGGVARWLGLLMLIIFVFVAPYGFDQLGNFISFTGQHLGRLLSALLPIAAFAAGIRAAAAVQRARKYSTAVRAFALATMILGSLSFANVGFLTPAAQDADNPRPFPGHAPEVEQQGTGRKMLWVLPPSGLSFVRLPEAIRLFESEFATARQRARTPQRDQHATTWLFESMNMAQARSQLEAFTWLLHFGIAWSLFPVITAWLGFFTALCATLVGDARVRRLVYWAVAGVSIWSTGALLVGTASTMYTGSFLRSQLIAWSTFGVPLALLLTFGSTWLVLRQRLRLYRDELGA